MLRLFKFILGLFTKTGQKLEVQESIVVPVVEPIVEQPLKVEVPLIKKPKGELIPKDDSQRIKYELVHTKRLNKPLYDLIIDLSQWVAAEFEKDTVITMLFRTQEEQEQIYGKGYPKKSPHQLYHAIDIRSRIFTDDQIKNIEDYLNNKYNSTNYYKWTAKNHKVAGGAYHFHIQYVKS